MNMVGVEGIPLNGIEKINRAVLFAASPEAVAVTLVMVGEDERLYTPQLLDNDPEAMAVTLLMVGEDEVFCTAVLSNPPEALAVTLCMVGEESSLSTPQLIDANPEAVAVTF